MPVYAVGSKTGLAYILEQKDDATKYGVVPTTAAMKGIRAKFGTKTELKRDTFSSKEVSATRQVMSLVYGNRSGSGSLPIELSYGSFDDFIEALFGGTWTGNVLKIGNSNRSFTIEDQTSEIGVYEQNTGVVINGLSLSIKPSAIIEGSFDFLCKDQRVCQSVLGSTTLAIAAAGKTFTRSAGSFITDGFAVGDTIVVSGSGVVTANQGPFIISSVTATVITCSTASGLTDLTATANCTVGLGPLASGQGGTFTAASTIAPFDSFTGQIVEGGVTIAYVSGLDLKITAAAQDNKVLFSPTAQSITMGVVTVTGTLTLYFVDQRMKQKFINGTSSSLQFTLGTPAGSGGVGQYVFNMGTIKHTSNTRDDVENTITETVEFQAVYDSTDASTIKITRVP